MYTGKKAKSSTFISKGERKLEINNSYRLVQTSLSSWRYPSRRYYWSPVQYYISSGSDARATESVTFVNSEGVEANYCISWAICYRKPVENYHLFNIMENTSRLESRFRYYNYIFYIGGVPVFNSSTSIFYNIFVSFCYACAYSTILVLSMAMYHHRGHMDNAMNESVLLLVFSSASCAQLYFRWWSSWSYART
jgi:hypothetical protein